MTSKQRLPIKLNMADRQHLEDIVEAKIRPHQIVVRTQVLLDLDESDGRIPLSTKDIVSKTKLAAESISRIKKRFTERGIDGVIPQNDSRNKKYFDDVEAKAIEIYHSPPPKDKNRWSYRSVAIKLVNDGIVKSISEHTVKQLLLKVLLNGRGQIPTYRISLDKLTRSKIRRLIKSSSEPARIKKLAQALLDLDESNARKPMTHQWIANNRGISNSTIIRLKKRFVEGGLDLALNLPTSPFWELTTIKHPSG